MSGLTSQQALQFAGDYARIAEKMRAADFHMRARVYETASRAAFLKAHVIAKTKKCDLSLAKVHGAQPTP